MNQGCARLDELAPQLFIFDKGGTLIDVHTMWSVWARELARRLTAGSGQPVTDRLFRALGVDPQAQRVRPDGWLATTIMDELRELTVGLMREAGLCAEDAAAVVADAWHAPDPVSEARPLADLSRVFRTLTKRGAKIAVATMDDRAPTQATLVDLEVDRWVDSMVCGDDGVPPKPAPDMVLVICQQLDERPASAVVVGDSVADVEMGRRAGVGLTVGVLSGVTPEAVLSRHADVVLESVTGLL
ncbi:MAG: HAD family hydrolase [Chloroflexota bacterium]